MFLSQLWTDTRLCTCTLLDLHRPGYLAILEGISSKKSKPISDSAKISLNNGHRVCCSNPCGPNWTAKLLAYSNYVLKQFRRCSEMQWRGYNSAV